MERPKYTYKGVELPPAAYEPKGSFSLISMKHIATTCRDGCERIDVGKLTKTGDGPYVFGKTDLEIPIFIKENKIELPSPDIPKAIPLIHSKLNDVEQLCDDVLDQMCDFHFSSVTGKGKVVDVIDGDTIRLLFYASLSSMAMGRSVKVGRQSKSRQETQFAIVTHPESSGFFSIIKIRLLGVDTAEKNTPQGVLAKKLMIEKYQSLNNIVYYELFEPDKYGRTLANLYTSPDHTEKINDFLIGKTFDGVGVIALPYSGGTKAKF